VDEGEEVDGTAVVAGCEAPEVFEPVEASRGAIAVLPERYSMSSTIPLMVACSGLFQRGC
jgi:hypothetical protein